MYVRNDLTTLPVLANQNEDQSSADKIYIKDHPAIRIGDITVDHMMDTDSNINDDQANSESSLIGSVSNNLSLGDCHCSRDNLHRPASVDYDIYTGLSSSAIKINQGYTDESQPSLKASLQYIGVRATALILMVAIVVLYTLYSKSNSKNKVPSYEEESELTTIRTEEVNSERVQTQNEQEWRNQPQMTDRI